MTDIDEIRSALTMIADEAPPPERVRARLFTAARLHRQRRLLMQVAGAGGVAATAGLAGLVLTTRDRPVKPPAEEIGRGWLKVPFGYRPTALPPGVGMTWFGLVIDDNRVTSFTQSWDAPDDPDEVKATPPIVYLAVGDEPPGSVGDFDGAKSVDIGGVEGKLKIRAFQSSFADRLADLAWQPPGGPPMRASLLGDGSYDENDPLAVIARSVRPDPRHTWIHSRFGWLPDDTARAPWAYGVDTRGGDWMEFFGIGQPRGAQKFERLPRSVTVNIGPGVYVSANRDEMLPQRVRGLDGWQSHNERLYFTLPDGIQVMMTLGPSYAEDRPSRLDELLRIAEEFEFGPRPDISWAGSR